VIVYDLAPPSEENCRLFEHLRATPAFEGRPIVITSTNAARVYKLLQPDQQVYEVIGKPYDLDIIVQAVKEAVRSRPTQ
jgi:CheY-like chemotaxis protein